MALILKDNVRLLIGWREESECEYCIVNKAQIGIKIESKIESKIASKIESKIESMIASKIASKIESKIESKTESENDNMSDLKSDRRSEIKAKIGNSKAMATALSENHIVTGTTESDVKTVHGSRGGCPL